MPSTPEVVNQARKRRVLVVDDSAGMRVYLRAILTGAGFESVEVADGGAAFDALMGSRFDLVVTDLDMPEMDGFALLSAISLLPQSKGRPPVVVCSALLGEGITTERRPELRLAAVLLAKPVQPEDVLRAAEKAVKVGPVRD
ncbi:MAG TPA: response regulator [Hyphomonadaceae bacterium]|jgi:two-component system chemotaxis response regulator CheY